MMAAQERRAGPAGIAGMNNSHVSMTSSLVISPCAKKFSKAAFIAVSSLSFKLTSLSLNSPSHSRPEKYTSILGVVVLTRALEAAGLLLVAMLVAMMMPRKVKLIDTLDCQKRECFNNLLVYVFMVLTALQHIMDKLFQIVTRALTIRHACFVRKHVTKLFACDMFLLIMSCSSTSSVYK
jgi:hypothetical protein